MKSSFFKYIFIFILFVSLIPANAQTVGIRDTVLMGSRFKITLVDIDAISVEKNINKAIDEMVRIENLISDWKPTSQVSRINQNAGIQPVKVDQEVIDLTKRALYFSNITEGAFDISFAAMDKIWKFDGSMEEIPTSLAIQKAIEKIGYQHIIINEEASTIFLEKPGMKIGFGSTGKGYAADKARELMLQLGINAGIIDASGDITTWGNQPNGEPWKIGITHPFRKYKYAEILTFKNAAVTTSGDYEKFVMIDGERYSHIINPKTGMPSTGLTGVTVIGPNAEMCNGFSTSIMVLGEEKGLAFINQQEEYAALLITDKGKIIRSKRYKKIKKKLK
ncbi:FAD:protein FMN transferase [Faecalibacter rhinopitheci]|uniref:FAD:protein FMN transferase n=1 Tax=Faecalibacter rhinopitheci TaxID=2779678 RepID=A0A8J7FSS4_9FLAO|nr:FAD:protein FMN transferase [Faecalibacter rhinopitheci]MBF0597012.1 FAD:protein FMN transferase [Faecalibacter rhinopitheci]